MAVASWYAMAHLDAVAVECYCPDAVLHALRREFGPDLECDGVDILTGYGERVARTATELGIRPDSPVVLCAARIERESGPRFKFRLRVGEGAFAAGQLDGCVVYAMYTGEADFPEPVRDRFVTFLRSLRLGEVVLDECAPDA